MARRLRRAQPEPLNSDPDVSARILLERDGLESSLEEFGESLVTILEAIFRSQVRTHSVTHRVKTAESLERKLFEKGAKYSSLADITDILGLRVITYFPDDVDAAAKLIEANFEIDRASSVDRRAVLEPDRFGYLSLHYIVTLSPPRRDLPEYEESRDTKFEIQIRSILQHAWAEIEHDLGYHTEAAIPPPLRRRFSRLAGLLEIADSEFQEIREEMREYRQRLAQELREKPAEVSINVDSLLALIEASPVVRTADIRLKRPFGTRLIEPPTRPYASGRAEELLRLGLLTADDVTAALRTATPRLPAFARAYLGSQFHDASIPGGLSLFYLFLYEVGQRLATRRIVLDAAEELLSGRTESGHTRTWARRVRDAYIASRPGRRVHMQP